MLTCKTAKLFVLLKEANNFSLKTFHSINMVIQWSQLAPRHHISSQKRRNAPAKIQRYTLDEFKIEISITFP